MSEPALKLERKPDLRTLLDTILRFGRIRDRAENLVRLLEGGEQ